MLETLYGKTFLILGSQLGLTWLSAVILLGALRNLYSSKASWVTGVTNEDGDLDLDLDWQIIKPYFWTLLVADFAVFLVLLFVGQDDLFLGVPLFTIWSILTGIEIALCLIAVDENLGGRVLALTALITFAAGLIGAKSGVDFSLLEQGLFLSLLLLIGFGLLRIFFSIPRWVQRFCALFGVAVFTGYLLYDFQRLSQLSQNAGTNNWSTAMQMSITIYLDIINLFLDLLDLLSK